MMVMLALVIGYSQLILGIIEITCMFVSISMAPTLNIRLSNHNLIDTGFLGSALFASGICSVNSCKRTTSAMLTGIVTFSIISGFYCCMDVIRYSYVIVVNILRKNNADSQIIPAIICGLAIASFMSSISAVLYNTKILDNICHYNGSRMTALQANVIAKSFVGPVTTATTINVSHKSELKMAIMQGVAGILLLIIGIISIFIYDGHFATMTIIDTALLVWFLATSRLCRIVSVITITHSTYEFTSRICYDGDQTDVLGIYCPLISVTIYGLILATYTTTAIERQLKIKSWSFGRACLSRNVYDVIDFRLGCIMLSNGLSLLLIAIIYLLSFSFKVHVILTVYIGCLLCVAGRLGINAADIRSEQLETVFMAISSYIVICSIVTTGLIIYEYLMLYPNGLELGLLIATLTLSVVSTICATIAAACAGRHTGSCCGGRKDASPEDERM